MTRSTSHAMLVAAALAAMLACASGCGLHRTVALYPNHIPALGSADHPVQACGPSWADLYIKSLRCPNDSMPFRTPTQAREARVGTRPGHHEGHPIDVYAVPCPSGTLKVHVDRFHCTPGLCEQQARAPEGVTRTAFLDRVWCDNDLTVHAPGGLRPILDLTRPRVRKRITKTVRRGPPGIHAPSGSRLADRLHGMADDAEAQARLMVARTVAVRGDLVQLPSALDRALPAVRAMGDPVARSAAMLALARMRQAAGDWSQATSRLTEALEVVGQIGGRLTRARSLTSVAATLATMGESAHAQRALRRARSLVPRNEMTVEGAVALASGYDAIGRPSMARRMLRGAATQAAENPSDGLLTATLALVVDAHVRRERDIDALEAALLAPNPRQRAIGLARLAHLLVESGRTEHLRSVVEAALREVVRLDSRSDRALLLVDLSEACSRDGQVRLAGRLASRAVTLAHDLGDGLERIDLFVRAALVITAEAPNDKAAQLLQQALAVALRMTETVDRARALAQVAPAWARVADASDAVSVLDMALDEASHISSRRVRGHVFAFIGLAYAQLGRHRKAVNIGREIRDTPTRAAFFTDLGRDYLDDEHEDLAVDALRRAVLDAIAMTAREPQLALLVRITEGFARADRPRETRLAVQAIRDP